MVEDGKVIDSVAEVMARRTRTDPRIVIPGEDVHRLKGGTIGTGYGSQHSMDPAGIFATAPGGRIVAPSTPFDYVGLMNAALMCRDPVLCRCPGLRSGL